MANNLCHRINVHCCKWTNIEKIINPSEATEKLKQLSKKAGARKGQNISAKVIGRIAVADIDVSIVSWRHLAQFVPDIKMREREKERERERERAGEKIVF